MNHSACGLLFVICAAAWPAGAEEREFEFAKQVHVPSLKQQDLLSVRLDSEVFSSTQDNLADLRLFDSDATQVPYLLRKVQTTRARTVRTTWPARHLSVRLLDDGGLEITIEVDDDKKHPHPNGLSLISPLKNFEQRVRVYTSSDGRDWEQVGSETLIFDYSRYLDVRSDRVPFPETASRHFRIVVDNVTAEQQSELLALTRRLRGEEETERTEQITVDRRPFRIDRIDFWHESENEQATGEEKTSYPVAEHEVEQDRKNKQTIVHVEARRQPLTSLELVTPDRNFSRHAVVEAEKVRGVTRSWETIGEGTLSRIDFKGLKREQLSISFPESRHAQYRLVIDDRDSPPLNVAGIKAEGNVYEIVYLAEPGRAYQLVYGSADAEGATYDTAGIVELLREKFQPVRAELAGQTPWQAHGPAAFKWSKLLNNPLLLGLTIVLLVIALGWGLYRAVRRMDKLPTE